MGLGIVFPNETPEKSFSMGSEMISDNLAIQCSEALILVIKGMIGYKYMDYRQTLAMYNFSEDLVHANRAISQKVGRINGYIKGTHCINKTLL